MATVRVPDEVRPLEVLRLLEHGQARGRIRRTRQIAQRRQIDHDDVAVEARRDGGPVARVVSQSVDDDDGGATHPHRHILDRGRL
jgi:hypothetical protein